MRAHDNGNDNMARQLQAERRAVESRWGAAFRLLYPEDERLS